MEIDELIEIAKKSVVNCYAPYSKFHVVSVLEAEENLFLELSSEDAKITMP